MRYAKLLLVLFVSVLALLIPGGVAYGAPSYFTRTPPPEPTGTPWLQTQYPSETPVPDTATPWSTNTPRPTATWVTPTSPPEETREPTPTLGVSPDPSPSATVTPGKPDRKVTPTWDCREYNPEKCLAPTGGGMTDSVKLALIAIGTVVCAYVILLARAGRRV